MRACGLSRVAGLVNLEGFGLPRTQPSQSPERIAQWLDELRAPPAAGEYASLAELAARVGKRNPRLSPDAAGFVAACWSQSLPDGRVRLLTDPAHRHVNPYLYRREEMEACWRRIEAPVLLVVGPRIRARRCASRRRAASSPSGRSCANSRSKRWPERGTCCIMSSRAQSRGSLRLFSGNLCHEMANARLSCAARSLTRGRAASSSP